jgi:hypothetical protein
MKGIKEQMLSRRKGRKEKMMPRKDNRRDTKKKEE